MFLHPIFVIRFIANALISLLFMFYSRGLNLVLTVDFYQDLLLVAGYKHKHYIGYYKNIRYHPKEISNYSVLNTIHYSVLNTIHNNETCRCVEQNSTIVIHKDTLSQIF